MSAPVTVVRVPAQTRRMESVAQSAICALLYSVPAIWSLRSFVFATDPDIWWHLATGRWILRSGSIPRVDPFSAYAMGKPWAAYSWLFDVTAMWLYSHFGVVGLALLQAGLVSLLIVALHRLISAFVPDFSVAALLTLVTAFAISGLYTPRPWLLTILFFTIELHVILRVRVQGRYAELGFLPLIFVVWANVHAQFVYGLFLLGLATADAWIAWWQSRGDASLVRARNAWTVASVACFAASLVNPFFFGIYKTAFELGTQPEVLNLIRELAPLTFRSASNYVLLLIGIVAVALLARRKGLNLFSWTLLLWAFACSFRSRRDEWMLAVVGIATIASNLGYEPDWTIRTPKLRSLGTILATALIILGGARFSGIDSAAVEESIGANLPAAAVDVVKLQQLPGPLFNNYDWGGYLIWSLPNLPVSIDGRAALHGTPRFKRSLATWGAEPDWDSDPELQRARLIIAPHDAALCAVLRLDPRFQLVYEDKVAVVFTRSSK